MWRTLIESSVNKNVIIWPDLRKSYGCFSPEEPWLPNALARQPLPSVSEVCCPYFPPSQERLLLSLLPAHIAMEMKAEIIQRLQGPKAGQMENTNNFHNLYVKRHTNVRYGAPCRPSAAWGVGRHITQ